MLYDNKIDETHSFLIHLFIIFRTDFNDFNCYFFCYFGRGIFQWISMKIYMRTKIEVTRSVLYVLF